MNPISARSDFIETHRRSIFRANLPLGLEKEVEQKESIYSHYTSTELLGIVVSFCETNKAEYDSFDEISRYRVYGVQKQPPVVKGILRKPKVKNINVGNKNKNINAVEKKNLLPSSQERIKTLQNLGISGENSSMVCFLCLGPHRKYECKNYDPAGKLTQDMCVNHINGSEYAFGFHGRESCKHGKNPNLGRKVTRGKLSESQTSVKQPARQQGSFRPYRK